MEVGDDGVSSNYLQQNDGRNESDIRCCSWKWWNDKVIDMNEAKNQVLFSVPMIITNICYYFIPLISVMFAGHLGEHHLASSNLANSWATVTGFAFMVGLSGALETLCGQGYGAKLYGKLGIYLQTSCIISIVFCFFISILWIYTEPILILFHQDPQLSKGAALYIKYLIPGLFAFGFLHNILRFLQTQSVVTPLAVCSVISTAIHVGVTHVLVHRTSLGYTGAPLAASISLWISVFMLASYVLYAKKFNRTWEGFSLESFSQVFGNLKLALTSAAMFCLEDWAFELLVLLAGLMPNADKTTSVIAMCVNTETITFMFAYGLSASTSTRVSNELGAGNSNRAKQAMKVALKLSVIVALVIVLVLGFGHDLWAASFSDSSIIIQKYASMTPFLLISIVLDCIQGIVSGVARGCGWQHLAVYINLAMFYLIGMPIAALLGFKLKLYAKGLWIGLICGLCCQAVSLMLLTRFGAWKKMEVSENTDKEIRVLDTWTQVVELTENTEREIKVVV